MRKTIADKCNQSGRVLCRQKDCTHQLSYENTVRYLKLHNGNIYDTKTNTILIRDGLIELL